MGGDEKKEVADIITKYTTTFSWFATANENVISKTNYISEYIRDLNINSVHQCLLLECYNHDSNYKQKETKDKQKETKNKQQKEFYHSIFYTVYYIINNLPEDDSTKTTIMKDIHDIVFSISMLFWASCNVNKKAKGMERQLHADRIERITKGIEHITNSMKRKLPEAKIKDICKYIYNIKDFAKDSIEPYFETYPKKILWVKHYPLINKFNMKINILVLINIFTTIFTDNTLEFENIFKDTQLKYVRYSKISTLAEGALEVKDEEVEPNSKPNPNPTRPLRRQQAFVIRPRPKR
jgi:hypothetical protein